MEYSLFGFIAGVLCYIWGKIVGYKEGIRYGQLLSSLQMQDFMMSLPGDERMHLTNLMRAHIKTIKEQSDGQTNGHNI